MNLLKLSIRKKKIIRWTDSYSLTIPFDNNTFNRYYISEYRLLYKFMLPNLTIVCVQSNTLYFCITMKDIFLRGNRTIYNEQF